MENKVVVISGSSRGIGAAFARLAHSKGAKIVVHGRTQTDELERISKELDAFPIVCDVSDKKQVMSEFSRIIDEFGRIDSLVNCAGTIKSKEFLELEAQDWYDDFNVNFLGVVNFCQAAIPHMSEGSTIVNISSTRGKTNLARAGALPYSVSNAGIASLTIGLAKDLAPKIRVNAIAPGPTETDMAKTWTPERRAQYEKESLIGRVAQPGEMAEIIYFFASDQSAIITGQFFTADGGYEIYGK
ncbi:MAG: SDR family oxidoreductase [Acidimicrobiia bacterium]